MHESTHLIHPEAGAPRRTGHEASGGELASGLGVRQLVGPDDDAVGTRRAAFLRAYPAYASTTRLDDLRASEYRYLDEGGHIYLDYTGSGVPAHAQLRAHTARLRRHCFGNPHSENPTSLAATELVERTRASILRYFNASPEEYTVVFTPNATGACRLVGEGYRFGPRTRLVMTFDNHNSVNGIREFARAHGAVTTYVPAHLPDLRVSDDAVAAALARHRPNLAGAAWRTARTGAVPWSGGALREARQRETARRWAAGAGAARRTEDAGGPGFDGGRRGLFAFPAQSNFTGVRHPLEWIDLAHERGYDVLLDAAAFVPTNRLDLSAVHPDFVPVSWYKVFGYPTGVGSLIARRSALARLRRPWFSGGTIQAVSVQGDWHTLAEDEVAFEDGTLNFLNIPDVDSGLAWIAGIGIDVIHTRVACLTGWLLDRLTALRHGDGSPMVRIYGPADVRDRGATVAFNFLDPRGRIVDERAVARDTSAFGISLRTGCFCNPGAGEDAFEIRRSSLTGSLSVGVRSLDAYLDALGLPSGGAIRVSLGLASTFEDVERFLAVAETLYADRLADDAGLVPRLRC